jgi:hypothetical protein
MGVSRMIRVVIVSMYEKVIERLLWNTAQHEYSTYGGVKEVSRASSFGSVQVGCSETHSL